MPRKPKCPDGRRVYHDGQLWRHVDTDRPCGKMPNDKMAKRVVGRDG